MQTESTLKKINHSQIYLHSSRMIDTTFIQESLLCNEIFSTSIGKIFQTCFSSLPASWRLVDGKIFQLRSVKFFSGWSFNQIQIFGAANPLLSDRVIGNLYFQNVVYELLVRSAYSIADNFGIQAIMFLLVLTSLLIRTTKSHIQVINKCSSCKIFSIDKTCPVFRTIYLSLDYFQAGLLEPSVQRRSMNLSHALYLPLF